MKLRYLLPLACLFGTACKEASPEDESSGSTTSKSLPRTELSDEDQAKVTEALGQQKMGGILSEKVSWFKGGSYSKAPLDKAPDLYLLYYTASW